MGKGLEDLQPVLGEAKPEWNITTPHSQQASLSPFIFSVHALDSSRLRIHASDFHSYTWESIRTVQQLEDLVCVTNLTFSFPFFSSLLLKHSFPPCLWLRSFIDRTSMFLGFWCLLSCFLGFLSLFYDVHFLEEMILVAFLQTHCSCSHLDREKWKDLF